MGRFIYSKVNKIVVDLLKEAITSYFASLFFRNFNRRINTIKFLIEKIDHLELVLPICTVTNVSVYDIINL